MRAFCACSEAEYDYSEKNNKHIPHFEKTASVVEITDREQPRTDTQAGKRQTGRHTRLLVHELPHAQNQHQHASTNLRARVDVPALELPTGCGSADAVCIVWAPAAATPPAYRERDSRKAARKLETGGGRKEMGVSRL